MSAWGQAAVLLMMYAYGFLMGYTVRPVTRRGRRR